MSALWELMKDTQDCQTGRGWAEALYGRRCSMRKEGLVRIWLDDLARSGMVDVEDRGCGIILYRAVG